LKLLFILAQWHALAKLCQHTDPSLDLLESTTVLLGEVFRDFDEKTCPGFETRELKREVESRRRRQAKASTLVGSHVPTASTTENAKSLQKASASDRRKKSFNRHTYKNHSLGDYVKMIRMLGTTDSYSTNGVCVYPCSLPDKS
jgi:hypothetical protein